MITDTIQNAVRYEGLGEAFAKGLRFAEKAVRENLPEGHYEIDCETVFANISSSQTRDAAEVRYEMHRKYADIQCIASGAERIDSAPAEAGSIQEDCLRERDIAFCQDAPLFASSVMRAGQFSLYFPGEWHRPSLSVDGEPQTVKKIVVKVLCK